MRDDEPFMPELDWHPMPIPAQGYHAILAGSPVCTVQRDESGWTWTAQSECVQNSGAEKSARLAVRRAEAAYSFVNTDGG